MADTKFTPGPWRVCNLRSIHGQEYCYGNPSSALAFVISGRREFDDVIDANAKLIASAPEMYEALECESDTYAYLDADESGKSALVAKWRHLVEKHWPEHMADPIMVSHLFRCRLPRVLAVAALAKSRGEGA